MTEMTFIGGKQDLTRIVQHNAFDGGGTDVQADSHRDLTSSAKGEMAGQASIQRGFLCKGQETSLLLPILYQYILPFFEEFCKGRRANLRLSGEKGTKKPKRPGPAPAPLQRQKKRGVWMKKLGVPALGVGSLLPSLRTLIV